MMCLQVHQTMLYYSVLDAMFVFCFTDSDDEEMKMKGEHSPKSQDDSAKERLSPEYVKVSAEPLETQIELRVHPSSDVNEEQTEKAATDVNYTEVNKSIPENNISVKQDEQDSGHEAVRCSDIENVDSCEKDPVVGKVEERDQDLTKETEVNKSSPLENVTTEPLKEQKSDSDSLKSDNVAPADRLSLEISVKEKGDVVVVNPDRESPSSESDGKKGWYRQLQSLVYRHKSHVFMKLWETKGHPNNLLYVYTGSVGLWHLTLFCL